MPDKFVLAETNDRIVKVTRNDILGRLNSGESRGTIAQSLGIPIEEFTRYIDENFTMKTIYTAKPGR